MQYQVIKSCGSQVLSNMEDESIDLIVTDPAYSSLEKHRAIGSTTRLTKEWFNVVSNAYIGEQLIECYRVLKPNSHMYLMCDQETMFYVREAAIKAGFTWWKFLIFNKLRLGMGYHYRNQTECICFIEKGKRKLNDLSVPDVLEVKGIRGGYPTEKPVELSEILIRNSSEVGDTVLDMYCGSGSILHAAINQGRNAIGIDTSKTACDLTKERLSRLDCESATLVVPRKQQSLFDMAG
jgi:site-specific DNA-methyltransferase (adenine-specific)